MRSFLPCVVFLVAGCAHQVAPTTQYGLADPDGVICNQNKVSAQRKIDDALKSMGMPPARSTKEKSWMAGGMPNEGVREEFELRKASVLRSDRFSSADENRRLRIELIPLRRRACLAVKLYEECSPATAPEGAPREWHWCGDPASGRFKKAFQAIATQLSLDTTEAD